MIYCYAKYDVTHTCTKNFIYGNVSKYMAYQAIYEFDIFIDEQGHTVSMYQSILIIDAYNVHFTVCGP